MDDFEAYGQLRERSRVAAGAAPRIASGPPRRKRSHWVRNLILLAVAYLLLAVTTTVQPLGIPFTGVRASVPFPGGAPLLFGLPNRPFVVLVIGLDRRPSETGPTRTDTLLLLRIDPKAHKASFLSIPRDSMMEVPQPDGSVARDRINTAFVYNWSARDSGAAPRAVMATVERNLGIKVDKYVMFDQRSAEGLIDAMGGVTIDNPREFGQADYSDDDVNVVPQFFAKGTITLDGYQAVAYGRIREGSTDFDRIERQQRVGSALIRKAESPMSVVRLPTVYDDYKKTVKTDLSMRQSAGVLSMLKRVGDKDLKTKSLGDAAVSCVSCTASIQLLDPAKVAAIVAEAFGDPAAGQRAADRLVAAGVTP
ncbi:MAG: LCP family protein [Chloroflexi bacterium]|nr:LCP family protein [Chloroflexota bacterium]